MNEETVSKLLITMENISKRLDSLEELTSGELQKLHATLDLLSADQQDDVVGTLQNIDAKISAMLEAQKLNFEIFKVISGSTTQH